MKLFLIGLLPSYIIVRCGQGENIGLGEQGSYQDAEGAN